MTLITTIGLDTAKQLFQLHGVNNEGTAILGRQLRRSEVLKFFRESRLVSLDWKRAAALITGHEK